MREAFVYLHGMIEKFLETDRFLATEHAYPSALQKQRSLDQGKLQPLTELFAVVTRLINAFPVPCNNYFVFSKLRIDDYLNDFRLDIFLPVEVFLYMRRRDILLFVLF